MKSIDVKDNMQKYIKTSLNILNSKGLSGVTIHDIRYSNMCALNALVHIKGN